MKKFRGYVLGMVMALSLFGLGYANGHNNSFELTTKYTPEIVKNEDYSLREKVFWIKYYLDEDIKR